MVRRAKNQSKNKYTLISRSLKSTLILLVRSRLSLARHGIVVRRHVSATSSRSRSRDRGELQYRRLARRRLRSGSKFNLGGPRKASHFYCGTGAAAAAVSRQKMSGAPEKLLTRLHCCECDCIVMNAWEPVETHGVLWWVQSETWFSHSSLHGSQLGCSFHSRKQLENYSDVYVYGNA